MIDLSAVLDRYRETRRDGEIAALATLVDVEGSTYMRPGARAFITAQGDVVGLLSGGCLEKDLADRARQLSSAVSTHLVIYDLRDDADIDFGLGVGCKGKLTILLERIDPADSGNPLEQLERHWSSDEAGACAVALDGDDLGARHWYREARMDRSRVVTVDGRRVFMEYLAKRTSLAIFGAGPDAVPVVQRAKALGWRVALWDHRQSALENDAFAMCDERHVVEVASMASAISTAGLRASVALVMTHNYRADLEILRGLAAVPMSYVGLLGPRERADELIEALAPSGLSIENFFSPAGLDLGAETPEAIALSIIAEIHAVLRGRSGGSLRHRGGPIHDRSG